MYILLDHNALHVNSIDNNLIPTFIVCASGDLIHDVPKIHVNDPGVNDNYILFPDPGLQIHIQLWRIFTLFHSSVPTHEEITSCDKILIILDSTDWDLYSSNFADNGE